MPNPEDYAELERLAKQCHALSKAANRNVYKYREGPSRTICKAKADANLAAAKVYSNAYVKAMEELKDA